LTQELPQDFSPGPQGVTPVPVVAVADVDDPEVLVPVVTLEDVAASLPPAPPEEPNGAESAPLHPLESMIVTRSIVMIRMLVSPSIIVSTERSAGP
jgi:hypothetical protein